MQETGVDFLVNHLIDCDYYLLTHSLEIEQAKKIEKQEKQKTIEEVFEWLTKNNYVTDLKETLIEQFKNK